MRITNITKFETAMKEHGEILNTNIDTDIDALKAESISSIKNKLSPLKQNNSPSSSNQPSAYINNCPLLKSLDFHSYALHFTKHLSIINIEGDTLLQLQKWWYAIRSTFRQYLSTNKIWLPYKKLKSYN